MSFVRLNHTYLIYFDSISISFKSQCLTFCCCSVTQSCLTLCDPMDCSTPGFLSFAISRSLLKLMSIKWVMPSNHLILCRLLLPLPSISPTSESFPMSQPFGLGGQSVGASSSTSVLPMNIQSWFLLGLTGLISLQSKGLSRVSSNTTVFVANV